MSLIVDRKSLIGKCTAIMVIFISLLISFSLFTRFASEARRASHFSLVNAQSPQDKAQNDYSTQLKKYNNAKESYITAKSNYVAFKTATSKTDAFLKTKDYLVQTNFLVVDYLLVIKEPGNQISWANTTLNKDDTFKLLDDEVNFLQDNWHQIEQTTTLEDLPPIATELSKHLENSTKPVVNKTLSTYEVIKTEQAVANFNQISQKLMDFASTRADENNRSIVNNWQTEIQSIKNGLDTNLAKAKADFGNFDVTRPNDSQKESVLQTTKLIWEELFKSKELFTEILRIT